MATGNEMYAKAARILTEAKRLIRTGGSQKEINRAFKTYQIAYELSCHLYQEEDKKPRKKTRKKSVMVEVPAQKQKKTRKKKSKKEVVKLGGGLEMNVRHIGKDTAVLDLFRDGKRVVK